jgi:predicted ferric reductase
MSTADLTASAPPIQPSFGSARRRGVRSPAAWLIWAVAVANAGIIVWLWVHGGGVSSVKTTGQFFSSVGRITGLLGAYSALVQLLLLARMPWMERIAGFDRLTVWHRRNGKACLYLVLAHTVLITVGYAMRHKISIPHQISKLWNGYEGMVQATFGTGLMILVVVTSLVIVRRKMKYEAWHTVHVLAYLSIILGWSHQVPTGNEFAETTGPANYWRGLYASTAILLILFRVVQPLARAFWFRLRVSEVHVEGPGVVTLRITGRHLNRLRAESGQFFLWRFLTRRRFLQAHPFSLSAAPDGTSLRITVKDSGDFTSGMANIPVGTRIIAEGPFGTFTASARTRPRTAMIAGGIGITPIRSMLESMHGDVVVVYRAVHEDDLIFRGEIDALAAERHDLAVHYVVGDHMADGGDRLLDPDHLRELIPDLTERDIYLCGPPAMATATQANLIRAGASRRHIHTERFAL